MFPEDKRGGLSANRAAAVQIDLSFCGIRIALCVGSNIKYRIMSYSPNRMRTVEEKNTFE